jgi:hypothetical protein
MNKISIDGGKVLLNLFGKYMPKITVIAHETELKSGNWVEEVLNVERMLPQMFNIEGGRLTKIYAIKGNYFISKKGGVCFDTTASDPKHLFLISPFGGVDKISGADIDNLNPHYYHEAKSNAGGEGYYYAITNIGAKFYPRV